MAQTTRKTRTRKSPGVVDAAQIAAETAESDAAIDASESVEVEPEAKPMTKAQIEAQAWEAQQVEMAAGVRRYCDAHLADPAVHYGDCGWTEVAGWDDAALREVIWRCRTIDGAVAKIERDVCAPLFEAEVAEGRIRRLAQAVIDHASVPENYEHGWDVVVETMTVEDDELRRLIEGAKTPKQAIAKVDDYVTLQRAVRAEHELEAAAGV
jgi:hypothetical protein